jgi:BirA family biotin operon repressor/biotin-[acetyl-CoA-carboxylase] ligase
MSREESQGSSPYSDLSRPPLNEADLRSSLVRDGHLWSSISVVRETGSTNDDLRAAIAAGARHGTVLVAEEQLAGKGRLDRRWIAPPRSSLMFSMLLHGPGKPPAPWGWLPLAAALSVCGALERFEVAAVRLKWPNDVLIDGKKVAGVLAELHSVGDAHGSGEPQGAVIVGIGVNVTQTASELPSTAATSLALVQATTDRMAILRAILRAFEESFDQWQRGQVSALRERYLDVSATIGRAVAVELPGGDRIQGRAVDIDLSGGLIVMDGSTRHEIAAADVTHASLAT